MATRSVGRPLGSRTIAGAGEFLQAEVEMAGNWRGTLRLRVCRGTVSAIAALMLYMGLGGAGERTDVHDLFPSWKPAESLQWCAACSAQGLAAPNPGTRQVKRGTAVKPPVTSRANSASRRYAYADGASSPADRRAQIR